MVLVRIVPDIRSINKRTAMIKQFANNYENVLDKLKDLPPLIMRGFLVYGFYSPALYKVTDFTGTAKWFDHLGMPLPTLNAYLAGITEMSGVVLLALGLGVRYISFPLIITMIVAIMTVHIDNGFSAAHNGVEIPIYFIVMLVALMVYGPGRLSLDHLIKSRKK